MVSKVGNLVKKIRRLPAAIVTSIVAFFELCLTGRADYAWRMVRAECNSLSRRRASIFPLILIPLMLALVIIFIAIVNSQSSIENEKALSAVSLNRSVQAGPQGIESREATMEKGTEPPACLIDGPARAAVIGCLIFSIFVWFYVSFRSPRGD